MEEHVKVEIVGRIRANIRKYGLHVHVVSQSVVPRFAYSIGLTEQRLPEVVLAGAIYYDAAAAGAIVDHAATFVRNGPAATFTVAGGNNLGTFRFGGVTDGWRSRLMLGAVDFYGRDGFEALQILPHEDRWTLDIPNLGVDADTNHDPVWRWLTNAWPHSVPPDSLVTTNLRFLQGSPATEALRCEVGEWEIFAGPGPDVRRDEMRVVPLSTALGIDPTLAAVLAIPVGRGAWREKDAAEWQEWASSREE